MSENQSNLLSLIRKNKKKKKGEMRAHHTTAKNRQDNKNKM